MSPPNPKDFDEIETAAHSPATYAPLVRKKPQLAWSDLTGAHTAVIESLTLVGSAKDVGLVIADPTVSRLHVELDPKKDGLWVRDLGSRNGTYVDGILVASARVPNGGKLRLGSTEITVHASPVESPVELW